MSFTQYFYCSCILFDDNRLSSREQDENRSIEGQIRDIRKYCKRKGYRIVRIYKDPGFSGTDIERPGLQSLIEYATRGTFDIVILWKYDRLSRNEVDFPVLLSFFKNLNIQIASINEPVGMENTPYNEFIVGIFGLVSTLYRKELIARTRMDGVLGSDYRTASKRAPMRPTAMIIIPMQV